MTMFIRAGIPRYCLSLLLAIAIFITSLIVSHQKAQAAPFAFPLLLPMGINLAVGGYVLGALAVAAIGSYVGYEYSDEIREHAYGVFKTANQLTKVAVEDAIRTTMNGGTTVMQVTSQFVEFIQEIWGSVVNKAVPKVQGPYSTQPSWVDWQVPVNGTSQLQNYNLKTTHLYIYGDMGYRTLVHRQSDGAVWLSSPFTGTANQTLGSYEWTVREDFPQNKLIRFNKLLTNFGLEIVEKPSTWPMPSFSTVVPGSGELYVRIPPVTAFKPYASNGDELDYDWFTGKFKNKGLPYTPSNENDLSWRLNNNKATGGVTEKFGSHPTTGQTVFGYEMTIPSTGQDVFIPGLDMDAIPFNPYSEDNMPRPIPVPAADYIIPNIPISRAIDLFIAGDYAFPVSFEWAPDHANVYPDVLDVAVSDTGIATWNPATRTFVAEAAGTTAATITPRITAEGLQKTLPTTYININVHPGSGGSGGTPSSPQPPTGWNLFAWLKYLMDWIVYLILSFVFLLGVMASYIGDIAEITVPIRNFLIAFFQTVPKEVMGLFILFVTGGVFSALAGRRTK